MKFYRLTEALEQRKFAPGQVKFSQSQWSDPHIVAVVDAIAKAQNVDPQKVVDYVEGKAGPIRDRAHLAPILYGTILQNIVEDGLFTLFMDLDIPTNAPRFSERVFFKLQRTIAGEHDEFWPLRSFIERRPLTPKWQFVNLPMSDKKGVTTAAATPGGTFIFNTLFMQKLMDYSFIKQVKPKGRKYKSNGGDIPDEYAYIEFLIMHELMHYSNDDFYYQKIIPNANMKIINWVGDFRSNYLLVKSGYEQLPMGLFNDNINYDRQKSYIEMYNLVLSEFEKLPKGDQEDLESMLDKLSDDHEPGQEEGKDGDPKGMTEDDIDKKSKSTEDQMKEAKDKTAQEAKDGAGEGGKSDGQGEGPGKGKDGAPGEIDWSNVRPSFDWKALVKRFLSTAKPRMEDTFSRPARRSVSQLDIARQLGSAAVKAGERRGDITDSKLGFCFDASGSMSGVIATVFANAVKLLSTPAFKNSESIVARFSGGFKLYKVLFAQNKAQQVNTFKDKASAWNLRPHAVFNMAESGGTDFSAELATRMIEGLKDKWNVIFFLDSDILHGSNYTNFMNVLKTAPGQVFVIFASQHDYVAFRRQSGMTTPNITYFA